MVLMAVGFFLKAPAQNNSKKGTEIPEIFQLNASMDFDKKAINEWVKEHSWKEAYSLADGSHTKRTIDFQFNVSKHFDSRKTMNEWGKKFGGTLANDSGITVENFRSISVTLYIPSYCWIEANYRGEQSFWEKDRIQETYQSTVVDPDEQAYFIFQAGTTKRSALDTENFQFTLEDEEGREWEAEETGYVSLREDIRSESFAGTKFYIGTIDLRFYFSKDKKPSWDQLTLSVVRANKDGKKEFTWDFE